MIRAVGGGMFLILKPMHSRKDSNYAYLQTKWWADALAVDTRGVMFGTL